MRKIFALLLTLGICLEAPHAIAAETSEDMVKAAFLRKFVEFIDWPTGNAPKKTLKVNVCFYGDSVPPDMKKIFAKTASNSTLKFSTERISSLNNIGGKCQMVFITQSQKNSLKNIMDELATQPVLVVSDMDGFADKGGMIGFEIIGGKVRYNVNQKAFSVAGLKIDAQLLAIAKKVVN